MSRCPRRDNLYRASGLYEHAFEAKSRTGDALRYHRQAPQIR